MPLIPDAATVGEAWGTRHGLIPINHMVCVGPAIAESTELTAGPTSAFRRAYDAAATPPGAAITLDRGVIESRIAFALGLARAQGLVSADLDIPAMFASRHGLCAKIRLRAGHAPDDHRELRIHHLPRPSGAGHPTASRGPGQVPARPSAARGTRRCRGRSSSRRSPAARRRRCSAIDGAAAIPTPLPLAGLTPETDLAQLAPPVRGEHDETPRAGRRAVGPEDELGGVRRG